MLKDLEGVLGEEFSSYESSFNIPSVANSCIAVSARWWWYMDRFALKQMVVILYMYLHSTTFMKVLSILVLQFHQQKTGSVPQFSLLLSLLCCTCTHRTFMSWWNEYVHLMYAKWMAYTDMDISRYHLLGAYL